MVAYKLVRLRKNGTIGSLFINRKATLPFNVWMESEDHPTKGYAHRQGWHCTFTPYAPHLTEKDRVWIEVEVRDFAVYDRPESQGGHWILANKMKINRLVDYSELEQLNSNRNIQLKTLNEKHADVAQG